MKRAPTAIKYQGDSPIDSAPRAPHTSSCRAGLSSHQIVTTQTPPPLFSVIVPFRNAARVLPDCLAALAAQRCADAEYILVDNASSDTSADIVRAFLRAHPDRPLRLITETRRGAAAARNRGAADARGAWLAFTDADCRPEPEWLSDFAAVVTQTPTLAGCAGCMRPAPPETLVAICLSLFTLPAQREDRIHTRYTLTEGGFPTANLLVRRDLFERIGGFDPRFEIYGEDHDLCRRLYAQGAGIKSVTRAVVRHAHRASFGGLLRQAFGFGRSHARLLAGQTPGYVLVEAPGLHVRRETTRVRLWLDFHQADKKLLALCLPAIWWPWAWLAPLGYWAYLAWRIAARRQDDVPVRAHEAPALAALLIAKSAALTVGRIVGSCRYRVVCV